MNFSFKRFITKLLVYDIFLSLFILIFLIVSKSNNLIFLSLLCLILIAININSFKRIYKLKNFLKNQSEDKIVELEKELKNNHLIYDSWYITDNYMFSLENLEKINYKDIIVIEGGPCLLGGKFNNIGYKQTIYLKDGNKYNLKSHLDTPISDQFTEFVKEKNASIYFGVIEEYMKNNQNIN